MRIVHLAADSIRVLSLLGARIVHLAADIRVLSLLGERLFAPCGARIVHWQRIVSASFSASASSSAPSQAFQAQ